MSVLIYVSGTFPYDLMTFEVQARARVHDSEVRIDLQVITDHWWACRSVGGDFTSEMILHEFIFSFLQK